MYEVALDEAWELFGEHLDGARSALVCVTSAQTLSERSRAALEELGWTVHVIWECQLKKKTIDETFAELLPVLAEELGKELKDA